MGLKKLTLSFLWGIWVILEHESPLLETSTSHLLVGRLKCSAQALLRFPWVISSYLNPTKTLGCTGRNVCLLSASTPSAARLSHLEHFLSCFFGYQFVLAYQTSFLEFNPCFLSLHCSYSWRVDFIKTVEKLSTRACTVSPSGNVRKERGRKYLAHGGLLGQSSSFSHLLFL